MVIQILQNLQKYAAKIGNWRETEVKAYIHLPRYPKPFFMYPPAAALINNGAVPLKRLRQKIYDKAFIFLDEMMNKKYKTFSENENLKGQFFCEGEKLKLAKLWLWELKICVWEV